MVTPYTRAVIGSKCTLEPTLQWCHLFTLLAKFPGCPEIIVLQEMDTDCFQSSLPISGVDESPEWTSNISSSIDLRAVLSGQIPIICTLHGENISPKYDISRCHFCLPFTVVCGKVHVIDPIIQCKSGHKPQTKATSGWQATGRREDPSQSLMTRTTPDHLLTPDNLDFLSTINLHTSAHTKFPPSIFPPPHLFCSDLFLYFLPSLFVRRDHGL
jgi:hypothetical protein